MMYLIMAAAITFKVPNTQVVAGNRADTELLVENKNCVKIVPL